MSIEVILPALLGPLVAGHVWFDATPDDLPRLPDKSIAPFLILSVMGGEDAEYVEQVMGSHTHARLQVSAYCPGSGAVGILIKQVRDTLLASAYTVGVYGSPVGTYDAARKLRIRFQQFSIWHRTLDPRMAAH